MNYTEVKRELKNEFESFLKPLGFKSKIDSQGCRFFKKIKKCDIRFGFGVSNFIDEFYASPFGSLGLNNIQIIENSIFNEELSYDTILLNKSEYFNNLNYKYKIENIDDILEWGKIIKEFYTNYAVPFFEKYSSIDAIDKLLNENPSEKVIYLDDLGWRIIKGLIAAKLNSNPKYPELRAYYKSEVESKFQGYFMYEKCMKTIEFLDRHTLQELDEMIASQNSN
jgi:hypothetical protein